MYGQKERDIFLNHVHRDISDQLGYIQKWNLINLNAKLDSIRIDRIGFLTNRGYLPSRVLNELLSVKFPNRDGQLSGAPEFGDKCPVKCDTPALSGIKISNANDHRRFSVPLARSVKFHFTEHSTIPTPIIEKRTVRLATVTGSFVLDKTVTEYKRRHPKAFQHRTLTGTVARVKTLRCVSDLLESQTQVSRMGCKRSREARFVQIPERFINVSGFVTDLQ
uniref:Uncharacterized protein n=1 Tax=Vespula pensylvanica TaxID=30213 RepID=A0A834P5W7_VESPE|nr:hypothetical protein H0235_006068 [Vespula pensylvanica]